MHHRDRLEYSERGRHILFVDIVGAARHDPPYALTTVRYPDFLYDSTGRFVYVGLTKKF